METLTLLMDNLLPTEIKLEIFSRLPADSVLQCRQVCKSWQTLLHHPQFAQMHLRRSLQLDKVGILYQNGKYGYDTQFYYGEYDENDEQFYKTLKRINHPGVSSGANVINSCNGLICLSLQSKYNINDYIYICNPITREYVDLPRYDIHDIKQRESFCGILYGFGYLPSTYEYKVVRIISHRGHNITQSSESRFVQVYTLGGGTGWRNKGETKHSFSWYCGFANGALHWLGHDNMQIVAFDLADEEFRLLPSPPCFVPGEHNFRLKVLGGLLCIVHQNYTESVFNIWSFKKANIRNATCVMEEQEYQSWSWHMEFSMAWEGTGGNPYDPFTFTKSGEALLWCNIPGMSSSDMRRHSILSRYDPKAGTLKMFDTDMLFLDAFPHLNSLLSLKAIGEEDVKVIGSVEEVLTPDLSWQHEHVGDCSRFTVSVSLHQVDGEWVVREPDHITDSEKEDLPSCDTFGIGTQSWHGYFG